MYAFTEQVREFEDKLTSSIMPLIDQWNAHGNQGSGTLLVKPHLQSVKFVSKSTREAGIVVDPIVSGLAGNSHIDLELVLVNARDDSEISRVTIRKDTGDIVQAAATNLTELSVFDQLVNDYVAAIAYEYLAGNNELTQIAAASSSPTTADVPGGDTESVPVEFIGMAATEVATKSYDKKLWKESIELARGDPEKQSGIYIQLRSRQLAKLGQTEKDASSGKLNLTGTYHSKITGAYKKKIDFEVTQKGNEIHAFSEKKDWEIEGKIEGNTIDFVWFGPGNSGKGEFTIDSDGNLIGKYMGGWGGGEWILTKASSDDISGTYASEATYSGGTVGSAGWKRFFKEVNSNELTLKQNGNSITATDSSESLTIHGTRNGDTIEFYIILANEIFGSWKITGDGSRLEGKWEANSGGGASGKWDLVKVK